MCEEKAKELWFRWWYFNYYHFLIYIIEYADTTIYVDSKNYYVHVSLMI